MDRSECEQLRLVAAEREDRGDGGMGDPRASVRERREQARHARGVAQAGEGFARAGANLDVLVVEQRTHGGRRLRAAQDRQDRGAPSRIGRRECSDERVVAGSTEVLERVVRGRCRRRILEHRGDRRQHADVAGTAEHRCDRIAFRRVGSAQRSRELAEPRRELRVQRRRDRSLGTGAVGAAR